MSAIEKQRFLQRSTNTDAITSISYTKYQCQSSLSGRVMNGYSHETSKVVKQTLQWSNEEPMPGIPLF